jgi:putative intracellular protease/amidase
MSVEIFKGDPSSVAFLNNPDWQTTHKLADYLGHADEFDAVFIPGGHGPIFDLAVAKVSQQVITEFAEKGKIVAAVCHGPAAFMNVTLAGGEHLLKRKEVTGFSNAEEDSIGLSEVVPFLLEDKLKEVGAKFVKAEEP